MARSRRSRPEDQNDASGESVLDILRSSGASTGLWSSVAGIVGLAAVLVGGIIFLIVDELENFGLGVLIVGLVLLFIALVLSPRAIAIFLLGRQGRFGANVIVMTIAFFAIAVLVNFFFFRSASRLDLTATRVFTLAPQTVQILEDLDRPVQATAFFVPGDNSTVNARQNAEDLLNEFTRRSNNFSYRFVDPELQRAIAIDYGITEFPVVVMEDLESLRLQQVDSFTEPDLVTGLLVATGERQKVVYFLTGHGEAPVTRDPLTGLASDEGFDIAISGMQQDNYRVLSLNLSQTQAVPQDAAVVVIPGPKNDMAQVEFFALTDYLRDGGRLVALFDPDTPDTFVNLISQWGVTLTVDNVADAVSNVAGQALTPLVQRTNGQFVSRELSGNITIAEKLNVVFFPQAASIQTLLPPQDMPPHIGFAPLAMSTPASWLESDIENVNFNAGQETRGPFPLVAVVQARGFITDNPNPGPNVPVTNIVVFGDSDFATNRFFISNDNGDIFLNSINWLAGDIDLISVRPKLVPFRELIVNTRERNFIKWSSWFFPPALMLILGSVIWWRRR